MAEQDFAYDPFDSDVMRYPLPYYERLRDEFPVYELAKYDAYVVSRYEDVEAVLADPDGNFSTPEGSITGSRELSSFNHGTVREVATDPLESMNFLPRREYIELRHSLSSSFRRSAVARLADFIREQVRDVLDGLDGDAEVDFTVDVGGAIASRTVCHILNIPLDEAERVLDLVNRSSRQDLEFGGFVAESADLLAELRSIARGPVQARRAAGATGESPIIDSLIRHEVDGRALIDDEILVQLRSVMVGGTETVPKVFAHGLMELGKAPEQRDAVIAGLPGSAPVVAQEMVRYCAPGQWFMRTAVKPVVVAGQQIDVGQRVFPLIMSANRDPRRFDDPNTFVWDRPIQSHLGFGQGVRFCLGTHLARLELQILLEEFLRTFPDYAVDEQRSERPPSNFQWGWSHVRGTPGRRANVPSTEEK